MGYLILAILSSMMVSVCMRLSETRAKNNVSLLAVNYAMCLVLSFVYAGSLDLFPAEPGRGFTLLWGLLSGGMYLGSFLLLQWNIGKNGVTLPATFMKLGVLVPTVLSVIAFGEIPGVLQVLGIVLAVFAIILINTGKGGQRAASLAGLVALLCCGGLTDFTSKIYEEAGSAALSDHYLLYTFGAALLLCTVLAVVKKQGLTPADAAFGLLIGIPNYYSARFLLASLASVPAVVAYPTVNVGTIVMVSLAGMMLFKEKLSRRQWTALGVILAALTLLNL
ncbi:MAG: hypothetical protein IKB82_00710 [Clostridia bacterium]|nr:hypothetical protein [Clostridia bacterium]